MGARLERVARVVLVAWVGSLWTIGYVAAPVVFATLARAEAGPVASRLFAIEAWIGLVAVLVLAAAHLLSPVNGERATVVLLGAMLACILAGHFGLQPLMAAARDTPRFGMLHGVSSALYLLESLLGLILVWRWPRPAAAAG